MLVTSAWYFCQPLANRCWQSLLMSPLNNPVKEKHCRLIIDVICLLKYLKSRLTLKRKEKNLSFWNFSSNKRFLCYIYTIRHFLYGSRLPFATFWDAHNCQIVWTTMAELRVVHPPTEESITYIVIQSTDGHWCRHSECRWSSRSFWEDTL